MKLELAVISLIIYTIVGNTYQESIAHSVLNLNHPLHTQIYEYQMSVVFGLYVDVRAVPRVRKRFFFRGGGRDLEISFRFFGDSKWDHRWKRNACLNMEWVRRESVLEQVINVSNGTAPAPVSYETKVSPWTNLTRFYPTRGKRGRLAPPPTSICLNFRQTILFFIL